MVDTKTMEVRIPQNKLQELKDNIFEFRYKRKKVKLSEMQSLIGKLNFACRAVVPGRAFCRRMIDSTMGARKPFHRIRITQALQSDLAVWEKFLHRYNGVTVLLSENWVDNTSVQFYTDAAGAVGFGAFFQGHWTCGEWPPGLAESDDITFKELFPIVVAVLLWGEHLTDKKVLFHCDNQAVVHVLNKQSSRSKASMGLLRIFVLACLEQNILFKATHIPGRNNHIADALSRLQLDRFRVLAPAADLSATPVPSYIWQALLQK